MKQLPCAVLWIDFAIKIRLFAEESHEKNSMKMRSSFLLSWIYSVKKNIYAGEYYFRYGIRLDE